LCHSDCSWLKFDPKLYNYIFYVVDLVLDLEGVARGAIDFMGLAWQDELLDYQSTAKARGRIHTPSYAQVVQPFYKSASDRWRAYEHPLMQECTRLSNWITAYGYDT
jgi:hypothetical protein